MSIEEIEFELWPGAGSGRAWRLANDFVRFVVVEQGAHIARVELFDGARWNAISVDYPLTDPGPWHGATVGRWANRIGGASFELDGNRYVLEANDGRNCLHGGSEGFGSRRWSGRVAGDNVTLSLVSPDGDQGFPGELSATCSVTLDDRGYRLVYTATTDRPTVVNLTTHVYWNFDGPGGLGAHYLTVDADKVVEIDEQALPIAGPASPVATTRFDCSSRRSLADIVEQGGYDNCFLASHALLEHERGWSLEIHTDQPGLQIYTGQHLDAARRGIAFEPQRIPNAPNRPDLGPSVLRPGETYRSESTFSFGMAG